MERRLETRIECESVGRGWVVRRGRQAPFLLADFDR
jgi:hypothetical protein